MSRRRERRQAPLRVLVLHDPEVFDPADPRFERRPGAASSLPAHVAAALRELGHRVDALPFGPHAAESIARLDAARPDLVFNLTEHHGGDRCQDAHIAAALELLGLPYTGAGPVGLLLGRDKAESKRRLARAGIRVPGFAVLAPGERRLPADLRYPLFVKPQMGDGSEGIVASSLAATEAAAVRRARIVHRSTGLPAICEEYVAGRELKVGVLGNRELTVLPPREVRFGRRGGPRFLTGRVKSDRAYRKRWGITYPRARLSPSARERVEAVSARVYRLLEMRDYGKIDLRLVEEGEIFVLEGNPNPDLAPTGLGRIASWAGIGYVELVGRVVDLARERRRRPAGAPP